MSKTFYLGRTKAGAIVGRGSQSDYGYTHAATSNTYGAGEVVPPSGANFSRSHAGAVRVGSQYFRRNPQEMEIVALEVVDAATYRAAMGRG